LQTEKPQGVKCETEKVLRSHSLCIPAHGPPLFLFPFFPARRRRRPSSSLARDCDFTFPPTRTWARNLPTYFAPFPSARRGNNTCHPAPYPKLPSPSSRPDERRASHGQGPEPPIPAVARGQRSGCCLILPWQPPFAAIQGEYLPLNTPPPPLSVLQFAAGCFRSMFILAFPRGKSQIC
jgi:hypothetical protein